MLRRNNMIAWGCLLIYVLASAMGMVLMKKGGHDTQFTLSKSVFGFQITWMMIFGIIFYIVSFLLWMYILQLFNLTYISPVAYGITYIFIMIFSRIFLGEHINKTQIIGVALIICGIIVASYKE